MVIFWQIRQKLHAILNKYSQEFSLSKKFFFLPGMQEDEREAVAKQVVVQAIQQYQVP